MVVDLNPNVLNNLFTLLHDVKFYLSFQLFKCAERKVVKLQRDIRLVSKCMSEKKRDFV